MINSESMDVALHQPVSKWKVFKSYLRYGMAGNWVALSTFLIIIPLMFYNWLESVSSFRMIPVVPFGSYLLVLVASFCIPLLLWSDIPPSKRSYLLLSLDGLSPLWLKVAVGLLMQLAVVVIFLSMILVSTLLSPSHIAVAGASGFIALTLLTVVVSCTVYALQSMLLIMVEHPARWSIGIFVLYIVLDGMLGSSIIDIPFDPLFYIRTAIDSIFDVFFSPVYYLGISAVDLSGKFNGFPRQLVLALMWLTISLILLAGTIRYRSKER